RKEEQKVKQLGGKLVPTRFSRKLEEGGYLFEKGNGLSAYAAPNGVVTEPFEKRESTQGGMMSDSKVENGIELHRQIRLAKGAAGPWLRGAVTQIDKQAHVGQFGENEYRMTDSLGNPLSEAFTERPYMQGGVLVVKQGQRLYPLWKNDKTQK